MPVVLVLAGVLAVVHGRDLEDAVPGAALAVAAERRAASLVLLGALDGGLGGLLGLGEGVGGDGVEGQEEREGGSGRHFGGCWLLVGCSVFREKRVDTKRSVFCKWVWVVWIYIKGSLCRKGKDWLIRTMWEVAISHSKGH